MRKLFVIAALGVALFCQGVQGAQAEQGAQGGQCFALGIEGAEVSALAANWERLGKAHGLAGVKADVEPAIVVKALQEAGVTFSFDLGKIDHVTAFFVPNKPEMPMLLALQVGTCSLALVKVPRDFIAGQDG